MIIPGSRMKCDNQELTCQDVFEKEGFELPAVVPGRTKDLVDCLIRIAGDGTG